MSKYGQGKQGRREDKSEKALKSIGVSTCSFEGEIGGIYQVSPWLKLLTALERRKH